MGHGGKMFNSIKEAIKHYLNNNPKVKDSMDRMGAELSPSYLPSEYDSTPYCTVMSNGKFSKTLGEYKADVKKWEQNNKWLI